MTLRRVFAFLALLLVPLALLLLARALLYRPPARPGPPSTPVRVKVDDQAALGRLSRALQLRTISFQDLAQVDASQFAALRQQLATDFPTVHSKLERRELDGRHLLFRWPGRDASKKPILLMAHQDVVPIEPGTEKDWHHPPFSGAIAEGFVWGRGALDNKSAMMAILEATEGLLTQGFTPERTVHLYFGADEEVFGKGAEDAAAMFEKEGIRFEWVLDEGLPIAVGMLPVQPPVALVGTAEKGYVTVELTGTTEGGHSSRPPRNTAIGLVARAVQRLEENPLAGSLSGPTLALFDRIGPEMGFGNRIVFANLWLFGPLVERILSASPETSALIRTTTAVTMFNAGVKENVLPTQARAVVNFRILPGESSESVLAHVREVIADDRVQVRILGNAIEPSPVSASDGPGFRHLEAVLARLIPDAIVAPSLVLGATDSRHFRNVADATYRFFPWHATRNEVATIHGTNEKVLVDDYLRAIQFYAQVMGAP